MRAFPLCDACDAEYRDPADRRFHAEPVACATCGPRLSWRPTGAPAPDRRRARTRWPPRWRRLLDGAVVAVKGLGGYHLACDATDDAAVRRLRDRKRRWAKPFAVMVRDLAAARALCRVGALERRLLEGPARPIVLLEARRDGEPALAPSVANGNRRLGVFLPYTPLHHLLLEAVGRPLVLTSGNLTDEPLATDDEDALARLAGLADGFLAHDREIRARYDDSVTRVVARRESVVRRARGYAPEPMPLPVATPVPLLAVGAELKHTFTLARGGRAHVAPHNGDLEDLATHRAFTDGLAHLSRLLALEPEVVVHDLHPEYLSTKYALERFPAGEARRRPAPPRARGVVRRGARHHGPVPGRGLRRPGHGRRRHVLGRRDPARGPALVPAPRAVRAGADARRGARGQEALPHGAGLPPGRGGGRRRRRDGRHAGRTCRRRSSPASTRASSALVRTQVARSLNAPVASSAGRLFDAAAALLGIRDVAEFEAQAAIDLELAAGDRAGTLLPYRLARVDGLLVYDPRPTLAALLEARGAGRAAGPLAAAFQATVAQVTREILADARNRTGVGIVCLSGGVFQNRRLASDLLRRLAGDGFEVFINRQVPVNDGGVSYGQAAVAAARLGSGAAGASIVEG